MITCLAPLILYFFVIYFQFDLRVIMDRAAKDYKIWDEISALHIESFNHVTRYGLHEIIGDIFPQEFSAQYQESNEKRIKLEITAIKIAKPANLIKNAELGSASALYPVQCREALMNYVGAMTVSMRITVTEVVAGRPQSQLTNDFDRIVGGIPVMVRSNRCHLEGLTPEQLQKRGEEPTEFGGYFILSGKEKIIRLLIASRRNYPCAIRRPEYEKRGENFTEFAIYMRCIRGSHMTCPVTLHYLDSCITMMSFRYNNNRFLISAGVLLKCFRDESDKFIHDALIRGRESDTALKVCIVFGLLWLRRSLALAVTAAVTLMRVSHGFYNKAGFVLND